MRKRAKLARNLKGHRTTHSTRSGLAAGENCGLQGGRECRKTAQGLHRLRWHVGTRHNTSPVRTFLAMSPFDVNVGARCATLCHVIDLLVPELPLRISYGPFVASSLDHSSTAQPPSSSASFVRSN